MNLVILGMGYLASYLKPCYHALLGEDLSKNVAASCRTGETARRQSAAMGFPVTDSDSLALLKEMQPEIILFSPPPSAAPALTREVLRPYYEWARAGGFPLPDLYACPPDPVGKFYLDELGGDVCVVNMLPNMVREIAGRDISRESYSILIFPQRGGWPAGRRARLEKFLQPIGYTLEVPARHNINVLGGFIASHIVQELLLAAYDGLCKCGFDGSYSGLASAARFYQNERCAHHLDGALPCSPDCVPQDLYEALCRTMDAWHGGIRRFYDCAGLDGSLSEALIVPQIDIFLQSLQLNTRDAIAHSNSCHATKGGILEKGLLTFRLSVQAPVTEAFGQGAARIPRGFFPDLESRAFALSKAVAEHGATLSAP